MIPYAAKLRVCSKNSAAPKKISATPLSKTKNFGFGKYGGIILTYIFGFIKWLIPAAIYKIAISIKCQAIFFKGL